MPIETLVKQAPKGDLVDTSVRKRDLSQVDGAFSFINVATNANSLIPPYWSTARDSHLRVFAKAGDHISSAVYTMQSKLSTIPFHIEPYDMTIDAHISLAAQWDIRLHEWAEYGDGWLAFFKPWIEDLLTQDNGAFFEILDGQAGNKLSPLRGSAISIGHLDAARCRRTGEWEYPIIYEGDDGLHKLHWTRVAYVSQMPSPKASLNRVGYSATSRAIFNAQRLIDMDVYNQEKLGSRPPRGILLVGGGLDPEKVGIAYQLTQNYMNNANLSRYSKVPVVGDPNVTDPVMKLIGLSELPDGFDQKEATTIAIASIALAFGVDARELFPMIGSGATRADALLQHIKQRGKGTGEILELIENVINQKVLPRTMRIVFDYQDDAQDRQRADISQVRSTARKNNIESGVTTKRVERERMLSDGEITDEQFAQLELEDGRLPDGRDAIVMFFDDNAFITNLLDFPDTHFLVTGNEELEDEVLKLIEEKRLEAFRMLAQVKAQSRIRLIRNALAALRALELRWKPEEGQNEQNFTSDQQDPNMIEDEMTPDSEQNNVSEDLRVQQDEREVINA